MPASITEFLILVLKIEVKFTYHKIKHFLVCNPVVSSIFRNCAVKFTIKFQKKPFSMSSHCPSPWQPWTPSSVCGSACSVRFPSMDSHPVCPSVSVSLTEHRVLRVLLYCRECQCFSLFHGQVIFRCMEGQYCLSSIDGPLNCFYLFLKKFIFGCAGSLLLHTGFL